jgi:hypothetical protein
LPVGSLGIEIAKVLEVAALGDGFVMVAVMFVPVTYCCGIVARNCRDERKVVGNRVPLRIIVAPETKL